ncbi:Nramp family divalent metal transporter [Halorarius litoreus]|uniref:Nramp family divalent metal transporter n=1 Tax=Halorarius litoreus TaxID=2962676 RepID=UPI0020CEC481|nr:Nramp family divalent metal transporter [Halorarius litoreus]
MGESVTHTSDGSVISRLRALGPALVLAAVVVGPGSIALSTIAGSLYGYQLLWVPVAATIFMITFTWMAARIGLVTGSTIFEATRNKFGSNVAKVGGVFGFLTILAFQAGNNAGIGFATAALVGVGNPEIWAIVFTLIAMAFIWLPSLYDKVELLVKIVVGIMLFAFVGTLALVGVDIGPAARGLVPSFPSDAAILTALGLAATNFSIAAAVYQTNLMKENDWGPEKLADEGVDTLVGIGVLGIIVMVILLTSAGVIYGNTDPVFSAQGMAEQLRPLVGPGAFYLFTIGFFFASLSSLVVNALIGATLLVDGFDGDSAMDSRQVKYWAMAAMAIGTIAILVSSGAGSPIELLRAAQALAVIAFPLLGFLVISLARDKAVMGEYTNPLVVDILAALGYLTIIGIIVNYLNSVLGYFGMGLF